MKELVFPVVNPWPNISGLIFTFIIIIIIPLIARAISKFCGNSEISKKKFLLIYIAYVMIIWFSTFYLSIYLTIV